MYLYVASVLAYFNIIHGFMEGGRFQTVTKCIVSIDVSIYLFVLDLAIH